MRTFLLATFVAATAAAAAPAAVVANFELNGSLANSVNNGVTLTSNGGTLGATGLAFGVNQGPTVSGLGALAEYTIDVGFTLDAVAAQSGYVKLIDFSNLGSDNGYYSYYGLLRAFPLQNSPDVVFTAGQAVRLTLSRNVAGVISAYIDGNQIYSQADPTDRSATTITGLADLRFFTDDRSTGGGEAASGFVDYIRIADTALTPIEITPTPPSAVPEPASWALMLAGFGLVGAGLRRRGSVAVRFG